MTLEELEVYVLSLETNFGATVSQINSELLNFSSTLDEFDTILGNFEKEVAVLRGRVDGLEAKVGELENQIPIAKRTKSALLIIDVYDFNTKTMKKTIKVCKGPSPPNGAIYRRFSGDDVAIFSTSHESFAFDDDNETGFFRNLNLRDSEQSSITGKELIIGRGCYNGRYYNNVGVFPTEKGSLFIVNRQKLV